MFFLLRILLTEQWCPLSFVTSFWKNINFESVLYLWLWIPMNSFAKNLHTNLNIAQRYWGQFLPTSLKNSGKLRMMWHSPRPNDERQHERCNKRQLVRPVPDHVNPELFPCPYYSSNKHAFALNWKCAAFCGAFAGIISHSRQMVGCSSIIKAKTFHI